MLVFLFAGNSFESVLHSLQIIFIDRPNERLGEAIDCLAGSNASLGWET